MYPRKQLDISWTDLAAGLAGCALPLHAAAERDTVERIWSPAGQAFACLSVRTGFDLLLRALELPPGSEVIVSAITIPHMVQIIEHHGLVAVPVDVDTDTLQVSAGGVEAAVTSRSRMVLVAHVFGSRMDLRGVASIARDHNLLLVEDCAQAWAADGWRGSRSADVSMFSFGTIKTATALGGAVFTVRQPSLRARLGAFEELLPRRSTGVFRGRMCKYALLKAASDNPGTYGALLSAIAATGRDPDQVIMAASRGFSGPDFWRLVRQRPSAALLRLLGRRLRDPQPSGVDRRRAAGNALLARLTGVEVVGAAAVGCSWWLFPVVAANRESLRTLLSEAGFDATLGSTSLTSVAAPRGRPEPLAAHRAMRNILYVPVHADMSAAALDELAALLNQHAISLERHNGDDLSDSQQAQSARGRRAA